MVGSEFIMNWLIVSQVNVWLKHSVIRTVCSSAFESFAYCLFRTDIE